MFLISLTIYRIKELSVCGLGLRFRAFRVFRLFRVFRMFRVFRVFRVLNVFRGEGRGRGLGV